MDTGTKEAKQMYNEAKLEARKVVRKAKNEEWVQFGKELEKDDKGNQRRFWARVNGSKRAKESMAHIYDKNGQLVSEENEAIGRWKEHFEGLFQVADGPYQYFPCGETTPENDQEIMREEVKRGVRKLMMRKAPWICEIIPEMLKAGGEVLIEWMTEVFNVV